MEFAAAQMRLNPQKYWRMVDPTTGLPGGVDHDIPTGDAYVGHGQAPWISEMYGYVFAASEAGLRHRLTHGVVVYPDEIGGGQPEEPSIIHYGLTCKVGSFQFTKCAECRRVPPSASEVTLMRWPLRLLSVSVGTPTATSMLSAAMVISLETLPNLPTSNGSVPKRC